MYVPLPIVYLLCVVEDVSVIIQEVILENVNFPPARRPAAHHHRRRPTTPRVRGVTTFSSFFFLSSFLFSSRATRLFSSSVRTRVFYVVLIASQIKTIQQTAFPFKGNIDLEDPTARLLQGLWLMDGI